MTQTQRADVLMVTVTFLAAISWMFSREAVMMMPPILFLAIRFLLAGAALALLCLPILRAMSRDQYRRCLGVGAVFGVAMTCWVMGLFHTSHVGEGAFLVSLGVVIVPVIAFLVFREVQPLSTWLALPVAVAGLALLSLQNGFRLEAGQGYFVVAAFIFAYYFTLNTRAAHTRTETNRQGEPVEKIKVPALALTAVVLFTVGVLTLVFSLILETWTADAIQFSGELVLWVVLSAIVGTAGRFLVQTYAQSLSASSHGAVFLVLEPVWVALLAVAWFGESMNFMQLAGCALIFLALIINRWTVLSGWLRGR